MRFPDSSLVQVPAVVDVKADDGWKELIKRTGEKISAARPDPDEYPLKHIVDELKRLGCSWAAIEYPYHDQDFIYDYLHDYGEAFNDCGKDCARIHFFQTDKPLNAPSLREGLQRHAARGSNSRAYLGYMVVRPTGKACIGRTIIRFRYDEPRPFVEHVHTCARYHTNLYGVDLQVFGVPFLQQDQTSHVCAGVALWTLCYDLHRRYRTPRFFPRQVTEIAAAASPLGGTGHGLDTSDMARMLRKVGCTVDCTRANLGDKPILERRRMLRWFVNVAYGYIESNTPVLLGYRFKDARVGHVVLLIGHDLRGDPVCPLVSSKAKESDADDKASDEVVFESDYVERFTIQDDRKGPYQTLKIWNDTGAVASLEAATKDYPRILEDAEFVFLMPGVTNAAKMLYKPAIDRVQNALKDLSKSGQTFVQRYLASLQGRGTRQRLYLQPSRMFKQLLLNPERGRWGLPSNHLQTYLDMYLPRHVYVCDFCAPSADDSEERWHVRGEMLLDATSRPYGRETSVLALRVENCLRVLGNPDPIIADSYDLDKPPYAPLNYDVDA